ncbi:conserved hypothetical protein [Chloroherpeton thalassium ATCC 35110]|uniref:DUF4905 domain-containing protein n=1 Tax=Chloroherpeton thalassium (strain ATCC 35110 / GB-78) TaxID=517418 RepID=B3QTN3_CHLT3|nr:DUF4905 domain-containing protein [Chloroherpeton thalassium]ACF14231.1 conserved hypothetical protein [Chloroherpeton thalassium ATCC 35110]
MLNFFKKTRSPKWEFQKSGNIWRAFFLENGKLICEHRSTEQKQVSFFLLDDETGTLIWEDFVLTHPSGAMAGALVGDGWWVGLEAVYQNLIFFHSFYDPTVPEHLGIWALESTTKKIKWARPELSFICLTLDNQILAYRESLVGGFVERYFLTIDPLSGNEGVDLGQNAQRIHELRATSLGFEASQAVRLPEKIDGKSTPNPALLTLAEKHAKIDSVIAGYDIISQNERVVLGFHKQTQAVTRNQAGLPVKALDYVLKVIENEKVIYEDVIGTGMSGLILDGFFTRNQKLYYVRHKDTLCCVEL